MSILELVICLSISKSLNSMWPLINTIQFVVFIAMWKIKYPNNLRFIMHELKRISMGEFLDGLPIGDEVGNFFGVSPSKDEAASEKTGKDRVGSESFLDNFGVTFLLVASIFAFIIALVLVFIYLRKRCKLSNKNKERYERIKSKVFWNPFIRYLFLNALKLNLSAMVAF